MTDKQKPEYWQWRRKSERWGIDQIYRHEVYATTDDSEVRQLFAAPPAQPAQPLTLVQATAPREIWLQISDEAEHSAEAFPADHEGITWCQDSVEACQVKYVRADLAAQPAPAQEPDDCGNTPYDEGPFTLAAPAQRLSDEQLAEIAVSDEFLLYCSQEEFNEIARAIEAAICPPGYVVVNDEPVAWEVYNAQYQNGYLVDSLDDAQLVDDMTNCEGVTVTPLYAANWESQP